MRTLVIEDDAELCKYLQKGLEQAGHTVENAMDGKSGLIEASAEEFDVIILDRMLPKMDGMNVLKALRSMGNETPVLILSSLGEVDHRVEGLQEGGDDYLVKPFSFSELIARVEALYRRKTKAASANTLRIADLELDLLTRRARRNGRQIELLTREFKLLEFLMRHEGQVVTKTMLLERLWNLHFDPQTNVVEVHISRLRQKIDQEGETPLINTVRGAGYVLREKA